MTKANYESSAGQNKDVREPRLLGDILNGVLQSDSPLAVTCRTHRFTYWRTTEPCIDLKLFTRHEGRIDQGDRLKGVLTRDSDDRYLFVESLPERKKAAVQRGEHIYRGRYINVNRRFDGEIRPAFTVPTYTATFTFKQFCLKAAEELLEIVQKMNAKKWEAGS